jgi:hypothetical protein
MVTAAIIRDIRLIFASQKEIESPVVICGKGILQRSGRDASAEIKIPLTNNVQVKL